LSERFLGGKFGQAPLNQIAELAISEADLTSVQSFIKDIFEKFRPSHAHRLLPQIQWAGIATTNYDLLIETAYHDFKHPVQILQPFIENGDRVNERMRDKRNTMLLKLHGCITRLQNPNCPLILSTDQYISHRQGRSRLFDHFKDWGFERPIIFIGHSLQDADIRAILSELQALHDTRPRYYIVAPHKDTIETRFWESRRVTIIPATFGEFMTTLSQVTAEALPSLTYAIRPAQPHPLIEKFGRQETILSRNSLQFLENDVEYVNGIVSTETIDPKEFYRGYSKGWGAVEQQLDVRRVLGDTILSDFVLIPEAAHAANQEILLIKAHAGAGKSILLRRIAWDASHDYGKLCLYLRPEGLLNSAALEEIATEINDRVFIFIDNAADRVREIQNFSRAMNGSKSKVTLVLAERLNEWNVLGGPLSPLITSEHELRYLTQGETVKLVELLSQHKALGTLEGKSPEAQQEAFHAHAGRQLLVALHEATLGRPFEDIIHDEYDHIVPDKAQKLYLSICVLNRLGVKVRAGIISRLHGIHFTDFSKEFFHPLEHIVHTVQDPVTRDYAYEARHPVIAEIVFERVLRQQEERFDIYLRVLKALNIDYTADRKAFRSMTRGKTVFDLFPSLELGRQIYSAAHSLSPHDGVLLHQEALYEMRYGNLRTASELLAEAMRLLPTSQFIQHSRSELLLKMAEAARTDLERDTYLRDAATIARTVKNSKMPESHAHHTLVKIGLSKLRSLLESPAPSDSEISDTVKSVQRELSEGLAEFPNDSHLLSADAELASILQDSERGINSLQKAFDANPRVGFLAIRLAGHLEAAGKINDAYDILEKALNANRGDKLLHFRMAKHLLEHGNPSNSVMIHHLQRSFTPGDSNYTPQLLLARQYFVGGEMEKSDELFFTLRRARIGLDTRSAPLYPLSNQFFGMVTRVEATYCLISRDGAGDEIPAQRSNVDEGQWRNLYSGARVSFRIAFNFFGPTAISVAIEGLI